MDQKELYYLAGLLEGEGYFGIKSDSYGTVRGQIFCGCTMTDEDVINSILKITNVGTVKGPYYNGNIKWKDRYVWRVSGEPAYQLMKLLLPLMHSRRSEKISNLIKQYEDYGFKYAVQNIITGEIYETDNLKQWCKENNLVYASICRTSLKTKNARNSCNGFRKIR